MSDVSLFICLECPELIPSSLEAKEGAEGQPNVVVCGACEIHLVASFQAQTDGAEMSFDSQSRIQDTADVVCAKVLDGTRKLAEARRLGIQLKIDETALDREEGANRVTAPNELESTKPVQDFEVAVRHRDGAARAHAALDEALIEVVVYFSFKHDVREHFVAHTPSQSRHVCAGLVDAEVIAIGADLKMILRRSQRHKPTCPCQECQAQE